MLCKKKKNWNFGLSYLRNGWHNLLQIWNVASQYRRALPQQICVLDKRSQIYEYVKIAALLFLLIYSLPFARAPGFLGRTTHYSTLRCLFILRCAFSPTAAALNACIVFLPKLTFALLCAPFFSPLPHRWWFVVCTLYGFNMRLGDCIACKGASYAWYTKQCVRSSCQWSGTYFSSWLLGRTLIFMSISSVL